MGKNQTFHYNKSMEWNYLLYPMFNIILGILLNMSNDIYILGMLLNISSD